MSNSLADHLHAFHDFEQPAFGGRSFVPQEKRSLPLREDVPLFDRLAVANKENLAGIRNLAEQDVAANPACAPGGVCQRLSLFQNFGNEEVLGNDE